MRTRASFAPIRTGFDPSTIPTITRGFTVKSNRPPTVVEPPFEVPEAPKFEDYQEEIENAITECLESSQVEYLVPKINRIARALSLTQYCQKVHSAVILHVTEFAKSIPGLVSSMTTSEEIGDFWFEISSRLNVAVLTFSPICSPQLPSISDVFYKALYDAYSKEEELYNNVCKIIIDAYNESRPTMSSETLTRQFSFVKATDLFDKSFMPLLIESVLDHIRPSISESLGKGVAEFLRNAQEITDVEEKLAAPLLPQNALRKLTSSVNDAVFTKNLPTFVSKNLNELISLNDAQSISICARLSSATNTTGTFTQDLANVFQREVDKCFKTDDPIRNILKLYGALSAFVNDAFGTNSARVLNTGFEKGFRVDDESTARKLELAIHKDFPNGVDIEPYVGLFRMLRCKDVFQSYHTLYLNRRALELLPEQLEDDRKFAEELKENCGSKYTEPIFQTISDYDQSIEFANNFYDINGKRFSHMRSIFRPLIFSRESWPSIEIKHAKAPPNIQEMMTCFEKFVAESKKGRKIKWSMQLSRVTMEAKGFKGVNKIKCNGVLAIVLLALADGAKTIDDIINKTLLEEGEIEAALTKLSKKKSGKLIKAESITSNEPISLNEDAECDNGVVSIFSVLPTPTESASSSTPFVHATHISAACMRILKDKQSLDQDELFKAVIDFLPSRFKVKRSQFKDSLTNLEERGFIKLDPSGRAHYKLDN